MIDRQTDRRKPAERERERERDTQFADMHISETINNMEYDSAFL